MTLIVPLALLGLLTLPAIILLHLLRNRRELLPISSLRLWQGLQQKRQGALPRNIPISLMLILQLLTAMALTLGLAQPVFSFLRDQPEHTIFILDTSTSMLAEDARPAAVPQFISADTPLSAFEPRFEVARQLIQDQLQTLSDQDTFVIIDLKAEPEILLAGDGSQKTQAALTLDNFIPGGTGVNLSTALTLANGLLASDRPNHIIVLTDDNYVVAPETLPDVLAPLTWQTLGAGPAAANLPLFANQALLNVSSRLLPDGRQRLFGRVVNYSAEPAERTLQISVDNQFFAETTLQLEAQGETAEVWTLPASAETVAVEIIEPDVLLADNRAELRLNTITQQQVLLLVDTTQSEPTPADESLGRALAAQPGVSLTTAQATALQSYNLSEFDLVVFNGLPAMLTTWPPGNLLVVNPPLGHPLLPSQGYVRNLRPAATSASSLLTGIDLSGVYFSRLPQLELPEWAEVDATATAIPSAGFGRELPDDDHPLIFHGDAVQGRSRVVVWNFDLAQSNLPARLALPLLTGNTLAMLLTATVPPVVPLGQPVAIGANVSLETPGGQRWTAVPDTITSQDNLFSRTKQPGLYNIYNQNDKRIGSFAVHAGSVLESNLLTHFEPEVLTEVDIGAGTAPPEIDFYEYWPWLVGLALLLIMVEGWLAWQK